MEYDLTYGSLGAGVQSSAVLAMSALGLHGCPRADYFCFADTQSEPSWVYDHLEVLKTFAAKHGMEVATVTVGNLGEDMKDRAVGKLRVSKTRSGITNIPAFVLDDRPLCECGHPERDHGEGVCQGCFQREVHEDDEDELRAYDCQQYTMKTPTVGMLNRQCTSVYKIGPLQQEARRRLGFKKGERIAGKKNVRVLMGISADEVQRAKDSKDKWVTTTFPLLDAHPPMTRTDCEALLREVGLPVPKKSACTFCPFRSDAEWLDLRTHDPVGFLQACQVDEGIRDFSAGKVEGKVFLHRSVQPLREVDFRPRPKKAEQRLLDFGSGEGGGCDGGHCGV